MVISDWHGSERPEPALPLQVLVGDGPCITGSIHLKPATF